MTARSEFGRDLLVVLDGLAEPLSTSTTLSTARTPFLDRLVRSGRVDRIDPQDGALATEISSEKGIARLLGLSFLQARGLSRAFLLSLLSRRNEGCVWYFVATPVCFDHDGRLLRYVNRSYVEHDFWSEMTSRLFDRDPWSFLPIYGPENRIDRMVLGLSWKQGEEGVPPRRGLGASDNPKMPEFFEWLNRTIPGRWREEGDPDRTINGIWLWGGGASGREAIPRQKSDRLVVGATQLVRALGLLEGFRPATLFRATGDIDTDLSEKVEQVDVGIRQGCARILLHLEGFDMASHRKDPDGKRAFLERVDQIVFSKMCDWMESGDLTSLRITSDHQSSPLTGNHEAGSVPALTLHQGLLRNGGSFERMTEWVARERPLIPMDQWSHWPTPSREDGAGYAGKGLCLAL